MNTSTSCIPVYDCMVNDSLEAVVHSDGNAEAGLTFVQDQVNQS